MLEHITAVAPDRPAPSTDWEPCKRLRNGQKCGERLDFSTDGMGRLVAQCPVCDWGWKPSTKYGTFERRAAAIAQETRAPVILSRYVPRACVTCHASYVPTSSSQKYCSEACYPQTSQQRARGYRASWREAGLCGLCGAVRDDETKRTCAKCRERRLRHYHDQRTRERRQQLTNREYWQHKKLRGAA